MQTKFVEANGLRFEVLEEGTGDRLALCLHGFPEHAISWRHQIPVLVGMGYRVWAVNQRGYGRTTRPTQVADYALPHLVDDVTALINAASAKHVVLIGHDWGAMGRLVLCRPATPPVGSASDHERPASAVLPCSVEALAADAQILVRSVFPAAEIAGTYPDNERRRHSATDVRWCGVATDVLAVYTRQITEPGAATAMLNWYRAIRLRSSRTLNMAQVIDVPTLIVWGERDVALDPICLNGTDRYVRDLTVKQLPGISHWVQQRRTTSGKRVATEVSGLALLQRRYERASVIRVDIAAGPDRLFAPAMHQGK